MFLQGCFLGVWFTQKGDWILPHAKHLLNTMQFDLCIAKNTQCFQHENLALMVFPEHILEGMNYAVLFFEFQKFITIIGQNIQSD